MCPHCGIPRPLSTDGPLAHFWPYASALLLGLALMWVGGLWFRYQMTQLEALIGAPVPAAAKPRIRTPAFSR
jgi:hypothetical protein